MGEGVALRAVGGPGLGAAQAWGLAASSGATLTSPLPTNGGLALTLALGARLLVEPTLPELGVETGPLDLPLEATKRSLEAFVVLNRNYQLDHRPGVSGTIAKLYKIDASFQPRQRRGVS